MGKEERGEIEKKRCIWERKRDIVGKGKEKKRERYWDREEIVREREWERKIVGKEERERERE